MKVEVNHNWPVRAYDLLLDPEARALHFEITMEFIKRGVWSPMGGQSGPVVGDDYTPERKGWSRIIFYLNHEVAEEYDQIMGIE